MRDWPRKFVSSAKQQLRTIWGIWVEPDVKDEGELTNQRILTSGGIALSVIILQAFISVGVSNPFALASVLCFALALPMQVAFVFLISGMSVLKPAFFPKSLRFLLHISDLTCMFGILAAFAYVSQMAALLLLISTVISIAIYLYRYNVPKEGTGIDD